MRRFLLTTGLTLLLSFTITGVAHAQSFDTLTFIKSELGEANIEVIDFGDSESEWGSLSLEWIEVLRAEGYDSLSDLAENYENEFEGPEGLNELRYQKAVLEVQQSQLPTQAQRNELQQQIQILDEDIRSLEQNVKSDLNRIIGGEGAVFSENSSREQQLITEYTNQIFALNQQIDDLEQQIDDLGVGKLGQKNELRDDIKEFEEQIQQLVEDIAEQEKSLGSLNTSVRGVSLIFNELEFYFSVAKWAPIPYSIVRSLKEQEGYASLRSMADAFLPLGQPDDLEALSATLLGMPYTTAEGNAAQLTQADVQTIYDAMVASQFSGEQQLNQVVQTVIRLIRNVIGGLAILWIVIAGARMTIAQGDETVITEQKRTILYVFLGLAIVLLLEQMINILYGPPGQFQMSLRENRAFDAEIYGIVSFIRAIIGVIAVAILVRSGIKAMAAQGQDDEIAKQRQSVLWVIVGLVVIAINRVIVENIFIGPTAQDDQITTEGIGRIINIIGNVLRFGLGFVGLIALAIFVYGAGMMIINYGNEELVNKSKTLMKNAVIGILLIIAAFTIVSTLVSFG